MIYIGVTGWGDHDDLYPPGVKSNEKLSIYSSHFPVVEVDSSFYAVQPIRNYEKWANETPEGFQFVVKAYQGMTGHERGEIPFETRDDMFTAFKESIVPLQRSGKLAMVLFQFPPWFDVNKDNVNILRDCKERMGDIPCAVEFRNQSWYHEAFREKTLSFLEEQGYIHSICDEPQAGEGSIPIVMETISNKDVLVRLHGRNVNGWRNPGNSQKWREVRYLYDYDKEELEEWKDRIEKLRKECKNVTILFNNNSGGHASGNAKEMIRMLDIEYTNLNPRQLDLFD
ncbi:DUF72 domain-containing protein [Guptibacillus algicola]|uniref:DUF72 domain-containing protein n=1 Tax=Guptibacillus algicola TaxID=225844 RepID=UPI001CD737E1|nr:DUF72 domain-containing protein [Alkalihalobacillus algicola]MCA0986657.1 DUF72 domain-containing protein [Alkalihalobacillus algicola]